MPAGVPRAACAPGPVPGSLLAFQQCVPVSSWGCGVCTMPLPAPARPALRVRAGQQRMWSVTWHGFQDPGVQRYATL